MTLQGAMLFVKDLERMTTFYTEVLGLTTVPDTRLADWVEFRSDGSQFSLHAIPADRAAGIHIGSPPSPRARPAQRTERCSCKGSGRQWRLITEATRCRRWG